MRKVPPGIQIILSMSEGPSQMAASDVILAAGCAVIKALPPNRCIDVHLSGNTLRRRILPRYWTVVQHRARVCAGPIGSLCRVRGRRSAIQACPQGQCCAVDFADRIRPSLAPSLERETVELQLVPLKRSEHDQPDRSAEDHGDRGRIDCADGCYCRSVDGVGHTGWRPAG